MAELSLIIVTEKVFEMSAIFDENEVNYPLY